MLLAQIKSNYSSGAESSSDNEGADKAKNSSKKVKSEDEDEDEDEDEEEQGRIHLLNIPRFMFFSPISLLFCIVS